MIKLRFKDFMDGKFPEDKDGDLYIVKNGRKVLYVGITKVGVWNRWFASPTSHMPKNIYGELYSTSMIARVIIANFPASLDWTIELWEMNDCLKYLKTPAKNVPIRNLRFIEGMMIAKLRPSINSYF